MLTSSHHYRPEIDGLRAFSVLSVVLFHAFPTSIEGGFIGVDIFFVISGFLISTHVFEKLNHGEFRFIDFFGRRIRRIFPALLLVMFCSLAFGWMILWAEEFAQLGRHIFSGAGFVLNFVLVGESGYFDNVSETKPMLHLWSLSVEEQFYILWPFLLWLSWRCHYNFLIVTIILALISFIINIHFSYWKPINAFFWPFGRFWELLSGGVLAWFLVYKKNHLIKIKQTFVVCLIDKLPFAKDEEIIAYNIKNFISIFGFILLLFSVLVIDKKFYFPSWIALIPIIGSLLIIYAGSEAWLNRVIFMNPFSIWVGLISYPLYLWHWPLLSYLQIIEGDTPDIILRVIAIIISIVLAQVTFFFVEKPIRKKGLYKTKCLCLVGLMFIMALLGWLVHYKEGLKSRDFIIKNEAVNSEFVGPFWEYTVNDICKNKYWINEADQWRWFFCMSNSHQPPTIILLGNSYANQLYPGIVKNSDLNHHSVLSIGTCQAGWVYSNNDSDKQIAKKMPNNPCTSERRFRQFEHINQIIENEKSLQYAIVVATELNMQKGKINDFIKRVDFIDSQGIQIIIFQPHIVPRGKYDIKSCYSRPIGKPKNDCMIDEDLIERQNKKFQDFLVEVKKSNPNVLGFNPNEIFCNIERKCSFKLQDDIPAFRDKYAHFSKFAASALINDHFVVWAKKNIPSILN